MTMLDMLCVINERDSGLFQRVNAWADIHKTPDLNYIDLYRVGNWSFYFGLCILLIAICVLLKKHNPSFQQKLSHIIPKFLSVSAILIWIAGVFLYTVGFYNTSVTGISVVLRAIIASFKMFLVTNELARVPAFLQNDGLYMLLFALIHFLAACVSSFGLIEVKPKSLRKHRGWRSYFTIEGKFALAFLNMYTGLLAPKQSR